MTGPEIIGVGCCVLDELLLLDSFAPAALAAARCASDADAIICQSLGGQAGLPTRGQVLAFLAERGAR